ncbi:MAG: helix-turn-helix domain-containing protein [Magnetococcales bacterium]|nr:helix-turn-helix domain-containing protein [Magnetococcales bacterium]
MQKFLPPILSRIGEYLKTDKNHLIAERLYVEPQTVSTWKGRNDVPFSQAIAFAKRENLNIEWLLTGEGPKSKSEGAALTGQHARDFQDYPEIGTALVLDVVLFVDTFLTENGLTMPPTKKVEMVKVLCRFLVKRDRERGKVSSAEENVIHLREYTDFLKAASA